MDEFDHFFDDQRGGNDNHTPIYHTPNDNGRHNGNKSSLAGVVCIIMAVLMCLVLCVNVIVLATLKDKIADEYSQKFAQQLKDEYSQAINDVLNNNDIVDDIKNAGINEALNALKSSVGQIANDKCAPSVARLYMYENTASTSYGIASGFLITDTNSVGTTPRYIVTNAHCVRYAKKQTTGFPFVSSSYQWTSYNKIIAIFENDSTRYNLEIVAFGSYTDVDDDGNVILQAENNQADLALLRIVGAQPSNEQHPSLKIASDNYTVKRGNNVALVGNPEGIGKTNSITTGSISQLGISISSWGSGTFIMTDAAVNGGNSGGPMVDVQGVVIGVVESKLVDEGIDNMGFALSSGTLLDFIAWASQPQNNQLHTTLNLNFEIV